jgi:hypothetical protein
MNGRVSRFATKEPTVCAVCRRRAIWIGYAPVTKSLAPLTPPIWLCGDTKCSHAARSVHTMPGPDLDAYEKAAVLEAGAEAAAFLEGCGTTDLAKLQDKEWQEFLRRIVTGFEKSLRRKILDGTAPF